MQTLAGPLPKHRNPFDAFRLHAIPDEKADQILGGVAQNVGEIAGAVSYGLDELLPELGLLVADRDKAAVVTH